MSNPSFVINLNVWKILTIITKQNIQPGKKKKKKKKKNVVKKLSLSELTSESAQKPEIFGRFLQSYDLDLSPLVDKQENNKKNPT